MSSPRRRRQRSGSANTAARHSARVPLYRTPSLVSGLAPSCVRRDSSTSLITPSRCRGGTTRGLIRLPSAAAHHRLPLLRRAERSSSSALFLGASSVHRRDRKSHRGEYFVSLWVFLVQWSQPSTIHDSTCSCPQVANLVRGTIR